MDRRRVYAANDPTATTVAPAERMIRCDWCSIAITPAVPPSCPDADDIVTYKGHRICVRCGMLMGVVSESVVEDRRSRTSADQAD